MHHWLLVHIVWTTRNRDPTIDQARAAYLWEHLPIIARQERARILELGFVATHIHILTHLHPTTDIPRLLQRMKGGTGNAINRHERSGVPTLRWAKGYSITSVSPRNQELAATYVRRQPVHHPDHKIPGWNARPVALATPAEPRLSAARGGWHRLFSPCPIHEEILQSLTQGAYSRRAPLTNPLEV